MRIVLVDDHHLMREGLRRLLADQHNIDVVASLASGEELIRFMRSESADVFCLDALLPGRSGAELSQRIKAEFPSVGVVLMVDHARDIAPARLIKTGAMGFVTKAVGVDEFVHALERVHEGGRFICREMADFMAHSLFDDSVDSPFGMLTEREFQVLLKIADGVSTMEIGKALAISTKTVATYRYRLFEKLGVSNDVQLCHLVMRYGLLRISTVPT